MTSFANRERGLDVEDEACQRWPLEPVDDSRGEWCDLVATDDFVPIEGVIVLEGIVGEQVLVRAGARLECKSCWARYDGRRGQFWIARHAHERLRVDYGWYVFAVVDRDGGDVLRMAIMSATTVDRIIDGAWYDCGRGGGVVQENTKISWSSVYDPADVEAGCSS